MTTITFLKALRDKLKIGNTRSIHLNALPGTSATKLDISDINYCTKNLADEFIEVLTTKANFDFDISFKNSGNKEIQAKLAILSKRINAIIFQNEDEFKEHGIKTFGFGYPLIVKRLKKDPSRIIKAPLFIWYLDIERNTTINSWKIVRNKSKNAKGNYVNDDDIHDVKLNEVLLSFLNNDEQVSISQRKDELLDDFVLDKREVIQECKRVMTELTGTLSNDDAYNITTKIAGYIESLPSKSDIDESDFTDPYIINGGVFGLYQSQKESIIKDIDNCIDKFKDLHFENIKVDAINASPHSSVETDPSQQEILNSLGLEPQKIIQGPPGTGKSQTLTALITNALANNLRCLVVCEKKTALDVIRNNIYKENAKLANLIAVVDDIIKDRENIVNSVRDRINTLGQNPSQNEYQYHTIKQNVERTAQFINSQHKLLDLRIYEGQKWTELVGVFLKKKKLAPPDFLNTHINYKYFKFHEDQSELNRLSGNIAKGEKLFSGIARDQNPFDLLSDHLFLKSGTPRGIQHEINENLNQYIEQLETTLNKIYIEIENYKSHLSLHFQLYNQSVADAINDLAKYIRENTDLYGQSFLMNDSFSLVKIQLFSIFSKKFKQLKASKSLVPVKYEEVDRTYRMHQYFQYTFPEFNKNQNYDVFLENIEHLNSLRSDWYNTVPSIIEEFINKLNSKSFHPCIEYRQPQIMEIENDLMTILNKAKGILVNQLNTKETLAEAAIEISRHLDKVRTIVNPKEDFVNYFEWREFYIQLNALDQSTIKKLVESGCKEWVKYFESWYYYWLLDQSEDRLLPKSDEKINEFKQIKPQLKIPEIKNIICHWETKQNLLLKKAKEEKRNPISLYNKRGSRGEKRNSLRKIIESDFDLFTSFFPVVMTNPSVCSSIIPLKEGLFDIVIFDEASQLRLEDTFTSLLRGKVKIVSGDSQQMPPSSYFSGNGANLNINTQEDEEEETIELTVASQQRDESLSLADSESLLDYAERNNFKASMLKVHYRSQHPDLIEFSNHAFYGNQLIPIPPKVDYVSIKYHEVNGLYSDQQNIDEAKYVIDLLINHIKPLKNGSYPSVGIATLNLKQRNLIAMELLSIEQTSSNSDHKKKISELRQAGLFIKNLENIQGDERDIIILSTTFGKRIDGSFRQNFGPLVQSQGHKLLNVIVTRSKLQLFVCSSIPSTNIAEYKELIEQSGTKGRGVFYAYLAYAKAISNNDKETSHSILQHILKHSSNKVSAITYDSLGSESPFEDEVYYDLAHVIGQNRIKQQHKVGSFRLDMVVKSSLTGNPYIAIECDGAKYHSSNEAYAWDIFRQKELEKQGFIFHRIWSTNWWNDHTRELDNLIRFIQEKDREELSKTQIKARV